MAEKPEKKARLEIDADLTAAGWTVQDKENLDLTAGRGVAVREFAMKPGFGFADYLLYLDRKAAGAVEAKPEGTLTGVEAQSAKYAAGLPDNLPAHRRPLPFLFESNGAVTFFTNGLDPMPRSRQVFSFPRPETLAEWAAQPTQLRARLKDMPPLDEARLWTVQARAIRNLEQSFGRADPRALVDGDRLRQDLYRGQCRLSLAQATCERETHSLPRGPRQSRHSDRKGVRQLQAGG
jgi:type I restriction enzyme R subunit